MRCSICMTHWAGCPVSARYASSARATTACASGSTRSAWRGWASPPPTSRASCASRTSSRPPAASGLPPVPQGQQMQYSVFVKGRLASAAEFENIVLRESGNGQVVRLKDVAPRRARRRRLFDQRRQRRHSRCADRHLPAAGCQRARHRQADQAGAGRPGAAVPAGHGLHDPLQHRRRSSPSR